MLFRSLKQPELTPLSVASQIAILLALTAGLFAAVPLEQMPNAERAVQKAAANIPPAVRERFESAAKLSDADREAIIEIGRQALARFQTAP